MTTYTVLTDAPGAAFEIHVAGCGDIAAKRTKCSGASDIDATDWRDAVTVWVDDELVELGYAASDVRVMGCAKSGTPVAAKPLDPTTCPGSGQPFATTYTRDGKRFRVNPMRLYQPCSVCGNAYGAKRGIAPKHKKAVAS